MHRDPGYSPKIQGSKKIKGLLQKWMFAAVPLYHTFCRYYTVISIFLFHELRHTFAALALQNCVVIKTVSGMLGHFPAGFTPDTYAHVTTAAQKGSAATMGNVLSI